MTVFVGHPGAIAVVALLCLTGLLACRRRRPAAVGPWAAATAAWTLTAAWEALVQWRTPEANIRVDWLVITPVLVVLSAWALLAVSLPRRAARRR
jgi:hypothetical protein